MAVILGISITLFFFLFAGVWLSSRRRKSARLDSAFEKVFSLLASEEAQNASYSSHMKSFMKENEPHRNTSTEYGFSAQDPIRANGPIGELAYLSQLRDKEGKAFIGHRLGSIDHLDVYEIASEDLSSWHILFMDMYWKQKDLTAPDGLRLSRWSDHSCDDTPGLSVTNRFLKDFPVNFWPQLLESTKLFLGFPAVRTAVRAMDQSRTSRPLNHQRKVQKILVKQRAEGLGLDS